MVVDNWIDSRISSPSTNAYNQYAVVFLGAGIPMIGRAEWVPKNSYKEGEWGNVTSTNGNNHGKLPVLFWLEEPVLPSVCKNRPKLK